MKAEPNRRDQMTPHEEDLPWRRERTDRIPVIPFYWRDFRPPDRDIEPGVLARCRENGGGGDCGPLTGWDTTNSASARIRAGFWRPLEGTLSTRRRECLTLKEDI